MPKYNFNCQNCGEIELTLRMSEIPLKECPKCGCEKIERVFSVGINSIWKTGDAFSKPNHKE